MKRAALSSLKHEAVSRLKWLVLSRNGRRQRARLCVLVALALATCAGAAWGCGWGGFENSIRFGYGETDRERERLPPLPVDVRGEKKRQTVAPDADDYTASQQLSAEVNKLWADAETARGGGELEKARRLLREYTERTATCDDYWDAPVNCPARRNSAFDCLDALEALDRGSKADDVQSYLDARAAYDAWLEGTEVTSEDRVYWPVEKKKESEERIAQKESARAAGMQTWAHDVEEKLSSLARDPQLADNADYLRSVGVYRAGQQGDAVAAFESVATRYPRSARREAALYMAGLLRMKSSATYAGEGATATSEVPCREPECRDEGFTQSRKYFARLLADYPRGRYGADARGWLAYLDLRVGDTSDALVEYYRLLADGRDAAGQEIAIRSLRLVRGRADDADMDAVESKLEDEPQVALTYAYHNLYNYAASYYLAVPEVEANNPYGTSGNYLPPEKFRWDERQEATLRSRAEQRELRRVADFAARLMRRYPRAKVGGAFAVRLAGAKLELGDAKDALAIARRTLSSGLEADERGQTLWIEGVAEYRLEDYASARRTLAHLAEEFPAGDLAPRARRLVALVAEDAGDLAGALEQYLALGYDPDVAYFVDVLMTPDQLASFVENHADSPRRDELLYALGLRYMRAGRYAEARWTFLRVRTTADSYEDTSNSYGYYNSYDEDGPSHPKLHFRYGFWDMYGEGDGEYLTKSDAPDGSTPTRNTRVYADWLLRDMKTLDDLERLQNEIARAEGDEAKAEAMYQLASYFYEGELLFYNPAAWRGMRAEMLGSLSETTYRSPGEPQIVWRYVQEHESPARALALYLDIVRLYPRTRAARDALYTAILCHQQLSEFNGYWRDMYDKGLYVGDRIVTLADLRRAYPNYRLPLAGSWTPSTRTVNGKLAWPAPPAPKKLTGTERVRLKVKRGERWIAEGWRLFGEIRGGSVRRWTLAVLRWLVVALVAACVLLVFRLTRRTRRFLYRQLARCWSSNHAGHKHDVYAPRSSYAAHLPYTWRESSRAAFEETAHRLARLALSERGRAALALNLFTHGLLTVVLWAALWAIR